MLNSELFMKLPEWICTPDGMAIWRDGSLVLSCPNFADDTVPSCVARIYPDGRIVKWFDVPANPLTGMSGSMGVAFDTDWNMYLVDNAPWLGREELDFTGRILKLELDEAGIVSCKTVAFGMEHPNGIRIKDGYMYVTQSCMTKVKTESGRLLSAVYRFALNDENIGITNTEADKNIWATFITENPDCQYGADGIVFDGAGACYVGNFGDGAVYRIISDNEGKVVSNSVWAKEPSQLKSTDGMFIDALGDMYIADFSDNAIARVSKDGKVCRIAQSPDCTGLEGGLDEPGEPIIWNGMLIASCFDLVCDDGKVNSAHEMPATLAMLRIY